MGQGDSPDAVQLPERPVSILALDVGQVRIGLAHWDERHGIREAGILPPHSLVEDLERLRRVAAERAATLILVGLPRNQDGTEGPQAKRSRRFAQRLEAALRRPLRLIDEYGTSVEATRALGFEGRQLTPAERGQVDAGPRPWILERFLREDASRAECSAK